MSRNSVSNSLPVRTRNLVRFAFLLVALPGMAQGPNLPSAEQMKQIVKETTDFQLHYLTHDAVYFRYRVHRVDPKEDTTRDLIESKDGTVGRLLQHNGQALTSGEDRSERERLAKLLASGDVDSKQKEQQRSRTYAVELIRAMPEAMLYTLTQGQPQLPGLGRPQFVFDFTPNPQFHPSTTAQGLLTGLAGRIWVDAADHHLVRMELEAKRNLDLAMGILARVYSGGTVEYDQRRIAENKYAYTHVRMHLRLRELMLKTVPYESDLTASDIQPLPVQPTGQEAIRTLLGEDVKTR